MGCRCLGREVEGEVITWHLRVVFALWMMRCLAEGRERGVFEVREREGRRFKVKGISGTSVSNTCRRLRCGTGTDWDNNKANLERGLVYII